MACKCAAGTCHDKCPCLHCQYNEQLVQIDAHVLVVYLVGVPFTTSKGVVSHDYKQACLAFQHNCKVFPEQSLVHMQN